MCILFGSAFQGFGQVRMGNLFEEVAVQIDTARFGTKQYYKAYKDSDYLFFKVSKPAEVATVTFHPKMGVQLARVTLNESDLFEVIDTARLVNDYFKAKIRFADLDQPRFPNFVVDAQTQGGKSFTIEIKLFPYFDTEILLDEDDIDLYMEEEKQIELPVKNLFNFEIEDGPSTTRYVDYEFEKGVQNLLLKVKAHKLGTKTITFDLRAKRAFINDKGEVTRQVNPLTITFHIRSNRLDYLNFESNSFYFSKDYSTEYDVKVSYSPRMRERKTYRIERSQSPGGKLIAELYVSSKLREEGEIKFLGKLRIYDLHNMNTGYLYLKDGDDARFITNLSIRERPKIENISVLKDGGSWTNNLNIKPGQKLEIRVEGKGLSEADIIFDGLAEVEQDTLRTSDEATFFEAKVPINISKAKITVFLNHKVTRYQMRVKEYQRPAPLDFVGINYDGVHDYYLSAPKFNKPVLYEEAIKDINIVFNNERIDTKEALHGVQYLEAEIRLLDNRNKLLDIREINNIVVCPAENSPRYSFYDLSDCRKTPVNLNDYLTVKTYNLTDFDQIIIKIKHKESKYGEQGYSRTIRIVLEREVKFDINISFPAGLLVRKFNTAGNKEGIGNFSGISTAALAQLSFYSKKRLGQLRPYNIGAGFIALNAFNFNASNENRDIGIVLIGTIQPINTREKFSVPLYLGGGYFLEEDTWFVTFGPGIRLRL